MGFKEAVAECVQSRFDDFPFEEPRAFLEHLQGIAEAGDSTMDSYHRNWLLASGIASNTAIAHDHKIALEALRMGLQYDQNNPANSAMAEQIVRRPIQHEMAVERDSKRPDYGGLGGVTAGSTEDRGRVAVPKFTRFVAEKQEQRARILKQSRLLREETVAECKRKKGGGKGKCGDGNAAGSSGWYAPLRRHARGLVPGSPEKHMRAAGASTGKGLAEVHDGRRVPVEFGSGAGRTRWHGEPLPLPQPPES